MVRTKKPLEESEINYEAIIGQLFLILGLFLLFLGSVGLLLTIVSYSKIYEDAALLSELYFFHSYMVVIGAFLVLYHKKIIVKGYRT
jgi:multisubunit Na+/H+ antiporter MnhG subunit